jgi:hypothetical protein
MIVDRQIAVAPRARTSSGRGLWKLRPLGIVVTLLGIAWSLSAQAEPDSTSASAPASSEDRVVHRHRRPVSSDAAPEAHPSEDAGAPAASEDAGAPAESEDAGTPEGGNGGGASDEDFDAGDYFTIPSAPGDVEEPGAVDAGPDLDLAVDSGVSSGTAVDAGEPSAEEVPDSGTTVEPVDAGTQETPEADAIPPDLADAGVVSSGVDAGPATGEPAVDDAGSESLPDAGAGPAQEEGSAVPGESSDAGSAESPAPAAEEAAPADETQQQATLRLVFYGVYDNTADSTESDAARDAERSIRKAMESWWGFEMVSQSDLDKRVDRVTRGFIAQSARPAIRLASIDRQKTTVPGDFGLTAKLRLHEGQQMIRLRVINQPDREPGHDAVFDDAWTEELPVEQLGHLIELARDQIYRLANERVQLKSWPNAAIMHVPPPVAIAGKRVPLTANLLCRGECGLVLHFFYVDPKGKADAVQSNPMIRDEKTGSWHVDIKNGAAGKLRYYFTVVARNGRVLPADISTGTQAEPFEFRILAPLLDDQSKPATRSEAPEAALQPGPKTSSPVGGAVTLGVAALVGAGAVAMGVITHVWYAQPITEVQAAEAKTFVPPVYATVGVAGALAIVGGILLNTELQAPKPAASTEDPIEQ